jgi:large subunit ribosomal protein L5
MADYTPRLKASYNEVVRPAMKEEFAYKNDMMIPKITKITLNLVFV